MADNFDLRQFLTENKLTKNAQLLSEGKFSDSYDSLASKKVHSQLRSIVDIFEKSYDEEIGELDAAIAAAEEETGTQVTPVERRVLQQQAQWIRTHDAEMEREGVEEDVEYDPDSDRGMFQQYMPPAQYIPKKSQEDEPQPEKKGFLSKVKSMVGLDEAKSYKVSKNSKEAQHLKKGDIIGSGEEVVSVSAGAKTPAGKVEVTLKNKDGKTKTSTWGKTTKVGVKEKETVKENKMTQRDKYLTRLVENALGLDPDYMEDYPEEEELQNILDRNIDQAMYKGEAERERGLEEGDEMAKETVIPEYNTVDELMREIDNGTNKVAEAYKISEMKKIAEALRERKNSLEESEHAQYMSKADLIKLGKDITAIDKAVTKLEAAFDKKFNKKQKPASAPKAEKVEALQETTMEKQFDLKKFLIENKLTTNSRMLNEVGRSVFGLKTEGLGDRIGNAVSGVGAKLAGGNSAILQKMVSTAGIKVGVPLYSRDGKYIYLIKNIDYKTGDATAVVTLTINNREDKTKSEFESRAMTDSFKDIINATPEDAQKLADKGVADAKDAFEKGEISYEKPEKMATQQDYQG